MERIFNDIKEFIATREKVYVYGAGKYGEALLRVLELHHIKIDGVCISTKADTLTAIQGFPVVSFQDVLSEKDGASCYGFILAMKEQWQDDVKKAMPRRNDIEFLNIPDDFFKELCCYLSSCGNIGTQDFLIWRRGIAALLERKCVLFRHEVGLGDLLTLEPILRHLKKNKYIVMLETIYIDLFRYNDSVDMILKWNDVPSFFYKRCLTFDFNVSHEFYPLYHMLDGYILCLKEFLDFPDLPAESRIPCYDPHLLCQPREKVEKICINNEASDWETRIYNPEKMKQFALYLKKCGYEIYEIGSDDKNYLGVGKNCFGLELHETAELMSEMDLYVGLDNGLMHLAQSIRLPVFVLFGCTCPNFRIHDWSRARVLWKNIDELPCAACHHRRRIPCNRTTCSRDKIYCLDWTVEEVIGAFETEKYDNPPKLQDEMYKPIWWNDIS